MADIRQMVRGGHWPTLLGAWLHLTVSFMVWLLIGALSLPMARALGLTGTDLSMLVALPLLGGAVMRVLGGWSCDWFGARKTGVAILLGELAVLLWGWLADPASIGLWRLALSLGLGGASFAVALPLAGQAYPPSSQGLALGLAAPGDASAERRGPDGPMAGFGSDRGVRRGRLDAPRPALAAQPEEASTRP